MTVYTLTRSRRKTLAIYIKPDNRNPVGSTVEVRAPLRLEKSEIERFVASKSQWIEQKQMQISARRLPNRENYRHHNMRRVNLSESPVNSSRHGSNDSA